MAAVELKGRVISMAKDLLAKDERMVLTISVEKAETENLAKLSTEDDISFSLRKWYGKRSACANNLFWECVQEMAAALNTGGKLRDDINDVYLRMLRDYGVTSHFLCEKSIAEHLKGDWKYLEYGDTISFGDRQMVECIAIYGSSGYTSKEFARLLDGVISEMEQMDLIPPTKRDVKEALENWDLLRDGKMEKESATRSLNEESDKGRNEKERTTKPKKEKAVSIQSEAPEKTAAAVAAEPDMAAGLAEKVDRPSESPSAENEAAAVFDRIEQNAIGETVTAPVEEERVIVTQTKDEDKEMTSISSGKRKLLARSAARNAG